MNTLGAGDGGVGGVVHLRLKDVFGEAEDVPDASQTEDGAEWPGEMPFWYLELFLRAISAVSGLDTPESCQWVTDPEVDWFTYLVASAAWSRLVRSRLDAELAARVVWTTVSQGRFALELIGAVRITDPAAPDFTDIVPERAAICRSERTPDRRLHR